MTKEQLNLRNVVKFGVTCLAVCIMFAFCKKDDNKKPDDDPVGGAPSEVTFLLAEPGESGEVILCWMEPQNSGNSAITKYQVKRDREGGGDWIDVTPGSQLTWYTFTGLTNGLDYKFSVRAINKQGAGPETTVNATPIDPNTVPTAPRDLSGTPSETSIVFIWNPPSTTNGSTITGYQVAKDGEDWITATGNNEHTFTGLTPNTTYSLSVRAMSNNGPGVSAHKDFTTTGGGSTNPFELSKLPQNLKMERLYGSFKYIVIKVGEEYLAQTTIPSAGYVMEEYFLKKTGDTWTKYEREITKEWEQTGTFTSASIKSAVASEDFLGLFVEPHSGANSDYNSPYAVDEPDETIAGILTKVKSLQTGYGKHTYWRDPVTSLFLKYKGPYLIVECSKWETEGISFDGYDLP